MTQQDLIKLAIKKAKKSSCVYRIAAVGLNKKGEVICSEFNKCRFNRQGGGKHAEMEVMQKTGVKTIILCRVGKAGNLLSIDPCKVCAKKANELGIKIISIKEN